MTDRESRIRALAAMKMATDYSFGFAWSTDEERDIKCTLSLERAARIIDAIDALPVPGEAKVCRDCGGTGVWTGHPDYFNKCVRCNGTGKAER